MDTWCNQTIPIHKLGSGYAKDYALFKSTLPTGITNDLLVASARHPVYAAAIAQLPVFNAITRTWARLQPHCAIMISAGPMFLTMVVKDYLLTQSSLPSKAVEVVNATELAPFITDLKSSTWHRADTKVLMWIGDRPWTWFSAGVIGLIAGLFIFNRLFMFLHGALRKNPSGNVSPKVSKAAWDGWSHDFSMEEGNYSYICLCFNQERWIVQLAALAINWYWWNAWFARKLKFTQSYRCVESD